MTKKNYTIASHITFIIIILLSSCKKEAEKEVETEEDFPKTITIGTIVTKAASSISETGAISGGNVSSDGWSAITSRGIVWAQFPTPTLTNNQGITVDGSGLGFFTSTLTDLLPLTTYYIRSYATNSAGTVYGLAKSFETLPMFINFSTRPGEGVTFNRYIYASIILGNGQEWMAENLRTSFFANGDAIPIFDKNKELPKENAWMYIFFDKDMEHPWGKLYNYYCVEDKRNVCPNGWRVPNIQDWDSLINYLYPMANGGENHNNAGGVMKSTDPAFWHGSNKYATNQSGFDAIGTGNYIRSLCGFKSETEWWCYDSTYLNYLFYIPKTRKIKTTGGNITKSTLSKENFVPIRCIKN